MAVADIPEVYGGPFADETDALQEEINKAEAEDREPDFDKVTENWETISSGTKAWLDNPYLFITVPAAPIVENVVEAPVENVVEAPVEESPAVTGDTFADDAILGGE